MQVFGKLPDVLFTDCHFETGITGSFQLFFVSIVGELHNCIVMQSDSHAKKHDEGCTGSPFTPKSSRDGQPISRASISINDAGLLGQMFSYGPSTPLKKYAEEVNRTPCSTPGTSAR